jgi:hypothetical protein
MTEANVCHSRRHSGSTATAAIRRNADPMATVACVHTIARVAESLEEDEDGLHDLSIEMDLEDGRPWIDDVGDKQTVAFTPYGIDGLCQMIADERADGRVHDKKRAGQK